eukprot:TRINITY_DN3991_c0_g1_i1.p1 TRINITY_DN3991_c0_g1~~TRINITY_DN3991_c0_g1_i1.p1  ORF type:complete len:636 (-),score=127.63 TRINITY_DN3991_c0_g1_i1:491-2353(-)
MSGWLWGSSTPAAPADASPSNNDVLEEDIEELDDSDDDVVCIVQMTEERRELQQQAGRVKSLNEEIQTLQDRLMGTDRLRKKEMEFKDRQIEQKELKTRDLEKQLNALRGEKYEVERSVERLEQQIKQKEKAIQQQDGRIAALEQEIAESAKKRETLQTQSQSLVAKLNAIQQQATDSKAEIAKKESQLQTLQQHMQAQEAQVKEQEAGRVAAESKVEQLALEIKGLQRANSDTQQQLKAAQAKHESDVASVQQLYADKSGETSKTHQAEIVRLRSELDQMKARANTKERQCEDLKAQLNALHAKIQQVETSKGVAEQKLKDLTLQNSMLTKETVQLKEAVKNQNEKIAQMRQQLTDAAAKWDTQRADFENTVGKYKKQIFELEKEQARLQSELKGETEKRKTAETTAKRLQEELVGAKQVKGVNSELNEEKDLLQQSLKMKEEEVESLRAEVGIFKSMMADDEAQKEIRRLRDQLEARNKKILQMEKQVDEITSKMPMAQSQLAAEIGEPSSASTSSDTKTKKTSSGMEKFPNRVAVRCTKASDCPYAILDRTKYAVPSEMTVDKFRNFLKGKLNLGQSASLTVTIDGAEGRTVGSTKMGEVNDICCKDDGCIHMQYNQ